MWSEILSQAIADGTLLVRCQRTECLTNSNGLEPFFEALPRLEHEGEIISAGVFLEGVQDDDELLRKLDRYVLAYVVTRSAHTGATHAVNLSSATLNDLTFPAFASQLLVVNGVSHDQICFEVSERNDLTETNMAVIRQLKGLGLWIGIDDMPEGYSGLLKIVKIRPNFLKISGELVKQLATEDPLVDAAITSIITFGSLAGIPVIAEQVENGLIKRRLIDLTRKFAPIGSVFAQGWAIGREEPC